MSNNLSNSATGMGRLAQGNMDSLVGTIVNPPNNVTQGMNRPF